MATAQQVFPLGGNVSGSITAGTVGTLSTNSTGYSIDFSTYFTNTSGLSVTYSISPSSGDFPPAITVDSSTGIVSGFASPAEAGSWTNLIIRATLSDSRYAETATFTWTITPSVMSFDESAFSAATAVSGVSVGSYYTTATGVTFGATFQAYKGDGTSGSEIHNPPSLPNYVSNTATTNTITVDRTYGYRYMHFTPGFKFTGFSLAVYDDTNAVSSSYTLSAGTAREWGAATSVNLVAAGYINRVVMTVTGGDTGTYAGMDDIWFTA